MPNFGPRWTNPTGLEKGGQALTYLVQDAQDAGDTKYVVSDNDPALDFAVSRYCQLAGIRADVLCRRREIIKALWIGEVTQAMKLLKAGADAKSIAVYFENDPHQREHFAALVSRWDAVTIEEVLAAMTFHEANRAYDDARYDSQAKKLAWHKMQKLV